MRARALKNQRQEQSDQASGGPGERRLHLPLIGKQFLHARSLLHALEMRHAVLEPGEIEVELGAAAKTPEEMRIDGGEVVEEPLASGEPVLRDLVVLEKLFCGEPPDRFLGPWQVTDARGRIDARQEGMNAGGTPGQQGNSVQFLHRVRREQLRRWKIPGDPHLDRDILGQR
jgi:hypothetical protein